jgi:hypothetical protein
LNQQLHLPGKRKAVSLSDCTFVDTTRALSADRHDRLLPLGLALHLGCVAASQVVQHGGRAAFAKAQFRMPLRHLAVLDAHAALKDVDLALGPTSLGGAACHAAGRAHSVAYVSDGHKVRTPPSPTFTTPAQLHALRKTASQLHAHFHFRNAPMRHWPPWKPWMVSTRARPRLLRPVLLPWGTSPARGRRWCRECLFAGHGRRWYRECLFAGQCAQVDGHASTPRLPWHAPAPTCKLWHTLQVGCWDPRRHDRRHTLRDGRCDRLRRVVATAEETLDRNFVSAAYATLLPPNVWRGLKIPAEPHSERCCPLVLLLGALTSHGTTISSHSTTIVTTMSVIIVVSYYFESCLSCVLLL